MTEPLKLEDIDGVGPVSAKKMRENGVFSPHDLAASDANQLIEDKVSDSRDSANELILKACELLDAENGEYKTAQDELVIRKGTVKKLTTGSKALDALLGGGIETRSVTEFYGEFGSGKSQLSHTISLLAQEGEQAGGLEGDVIYIDTEGTFRPERLLEILATRYPLLKEEDRDKYMSRVHTAKAYNSAWLWHLVKTAGKTIMERNVKLMIVDSLTSLHRAEFIGRGQLSDRQQSLNRIAHKLTRIADYFNIAVVFTNQTMSRPDTFFGDPIVAVGGNVVGHGSTYRIYLRKSGANKLATFIDSPYNAYEQAKFTVTAAGVTDIEEKKEKKTKEDK